MTTVGILGKEEMEEIHCWLEKLGIVITSPHSFISNAKVDKSNGSVIEIEIEHWVNETERIVPDTSLETLRNAIEKMPPRKVILQFEENTISYKNGNLKSSVLIPEGERNKAREILNNLAMVGYYKFPPFLTLFANNKGEYIRTEEVLVGKFEDQ